MSAIDTLQKILNGTLNGKTLTEDYPSVQEARRRVSQFHGAKGALETTYTPEELEKVLPGLDELDVFRINKTVIFSRPFNELQLESRSR